MPTMLPPQLATRLPLVSDLSLPPAAVPGLVDPAATPILDAVATALPPRHTRDAPPESGTMETHLTEAEASSASS